MLGLQRHPDHHANGYKPYQILKSYTKGPTLPCGYISCLVVTLVPPVWYRITHPILKGYKEDCKASEQQIKSSENSFLSWMVLQSMFVSSIPFLI